MKGEPELYKPAEACRVAEVAPYVLRYWETEFPALSEGKSKGPARLYTAREVKIISRIRQLLYDEGFTVAGAKKRLEGEIAEGRFDDGSPAPAAAQKKPAPAQSSPRLATPAPSPAASPPIREALAPSGFPERKKVIAELKDIVKVLERGRRRG